LWENGNFKCTHTGRPGISLRHVYIVLAAGAAAEELEFGGNYNPRGSSADSASISKFGGARIEDYLLEATEILAARRQELESIVKELQTTEWAASCQIARASMLMLVILLPRFTTDPTDPQRQPSKSVYAQ